MSTFHLTIITPESTPFDGDVASLVAPGIAGFFGVMDRHAPMVSALGSGILRVMTEAEPRYFIIGGGVAEVSQDRVTILADTVLPADGPGDAELKLEEVRLEIERNAKSAV